jgi:hypothetical protein
MVTLDILLATLFPVFTYEVGILVGIAMGRYKQ